MAFVSLKNWSERKGEENTAQAIAPRATKELGGIRDATLFAMTPPSVDGLGQSNGFTFELMASGGTDRDSLMKMRSQLLAGESKYRAAVGTRQRSAANAAAAGGYR